MSTKQEQVESLFLGKTISRIEFPGWMLTLEFTDGTAVELREDDDHNRWSAKSVAVKSVWDVAVSNLTSLECQDLLKWLAAHNRAPNIQNIEMWKRERGIK